MINNKHMMVVLHVDDLKVSHVNSFEITNFAGYLSSIYGLLTVHRVKLHEYFSMYLYYIEQVTLKLSMIKYLDSVLQEVPYHLGKITATLEANHLFTVQN